jgi:hypothetical protein
MAAIKGKSRLTNHYLLTVFNVWLLYFEGGRGNEKREVSKYFASEKLTPNPTAWREVAGNAVIHIYFTASWKQVLSLDLRLPLRC